MRYVEEYRDPETARQYVEALHRTTTHEWTIMEVCGGQTHTIIKSGIDTLLPDKVRLVHGPGCPVCVTPVELIDKAVAIAGMAGVVFCSFGDMLRVPGSGKDLLTVKSEGGDVRMVYSPLDALKIAETMPDKRVVFFAVGFETTAPANAMAVAEAKRRGVSNFSLLVSHVLVPPAIEAIMSSPDNAVQAFLAAGHVCTVMGYEEYAVLSAKYHLPIIVTGFEPLDLLQGLFMAVRQLEEGRAEVENQYSRAVRREGNVPARKLMANVFETMDRKWRGIGLIPNSGYRLAEEYRDFDAELIFDVESLSVQEDPRCLSGLVLQGLKRPDECPMFGGECTPVHPLGATMVSSEGACAAYYNYGRSRRS